MDLKSTRFRSESNTPLTSEYRAVASSRPRCSVGPFVEGMYQYPARNINSLLFDGSNSKTVILKRFDRLRSIASPKGLPGQAVDHRRFSTQTGRTRFLIRLLSEEQLESAGSSEWLSSNVARNQHTRQYR